MEPASKTNRISFLFAGQYNYLSPSDHMLRAPEQFCSQHEMQNGQYHVFVTISHERWTICANISIFFDNLSTYETVLVVLDYEPLRIAKCTKNTISFGSWGRCICIISMFHSRVNTPLSLCINTPIRALSSSRPFPYFFGLTVWLFKFTDSPSWCI